MSDYTLWKKFVFIPDIIVEMGQTYNIFILNLTNKFNEKSSKEVSLSVIM